MLRSPWYDYAYDAVTAILQGKAQFHNKKGSNSSNLSSSSASASSASSLLIGGGLGNNAQEAAKLRLSNLAEQLKAAWHKVMFLLILLFALSCIEQFAQMK